MIKKQILEKLNNSISCTQVAVELHANGYITYTETQVRALVNRNGKRLTEPHMLEAISKVTGISVEELLETEKATA